MNALPSPPSDGITCLSYLPDTDADNSSKLLACSSWDGTVRLYDTTALTNVCIQSMDSGPVLSLAVGASGGTLFTGGLDGSVRRFDIASNQVSCIGYHSPHIQGPTNDQEQQQLACSCLAPLSLTPTTASKQHNDTPVLASAGWDKNFYLWDVRMNSNNIAKNSKPAAHITLPNKAYSMDVDSSTGTRVVVATAGRRNVFIDVRMGVDATPLNDTIVEHAEIVLDRESTLKYQSRVCRFFPDGSAIAAGSIEGRVAIEFIEELGIPPPTNMKKYAFKCHRVNDNVFPVNCIAFHKAYGTFATGGCDGTVVTWDGLHKKKLSMLHKFPTSISSLCFNHDGTELAIAASYTFEEGERDHPRDEIYIRKIEDSEVRPKSVKEK